MIALELALHIVNAAFKAAALKGLTRLAVVVTDGGGHIRAAMRSDGHAAFSFDVAHAKARSALGFRLSTLRLATHFIEHPSSTIGIVGAAAGSFVPIGGGIVVVDGEGHIVGAAAVAGGVPTVDDAVVRAALQDTGLRALP